MAARAARLARAAGERPGGSGRGCPRGQPHPPAADGLRYGTAPQPRRTEPHIGARGVSLRLGAAVERKPALVGGAARGRNGAAGARRAGLVGGVEKAQAGGARRFRARPAVERVRLRELLRHGGLGLRGSGRSRRVHAGGALERGAARVVRGAGSTAPGGIADLSLDFHSRHLPDGLPGSSEASIHAGCNAMNTLRRSTPDGRRTKPAISALL